MDSERRIGRNILREEGDIVFVKQVGDVSMQELKIIYDLLEEMLSRNPNTYAIFDVTDGIAFGSEQRKLTNEWARKWQFAGMAFFGGSVVMRTVIHAVYRATSIFRRGKVAPMGTFKTEEEARSFFDELRKQAAQAQGATQGDSGSS